MMACVTCYPIRKARRRLLYAALCLAYVHLQRNYVPHGTVHEGRGPQKGFWDHNMMTDWLVNGGNRLRSAV
jgi:hypothetical protein